MIEFTVSDSQGRGPRLDRFLAENLHSISLTRIRTMIRDGDVEVNGAGSQKGVRLQTGDVVTLKTDEASQASTSATPQQLPIEILYEDESIVVVNKPSGMLTHPSNRERSGALTNALAHHFILTSGRPIRAGLVHRLDRDTSGAIVVAKTLRAHRILSNAFRERRVRKTYLAVVSGAPNADSGVIDAPIGCDKTDWPHWKVMDSGRPAKSNYIVLRRFPMHALLRLEPLTGRTHQIRIHCRLEGCPLLGDPVYGIRNDPQAKRLGIKRQFLHAERLVFPHPVSGKEIDIAVPMPETMAGIIGRLSVETAFETVNSVDSLNGKSEP
ncbi:MAG: RluA family pseudouridine synthase [Acidobacteria bacterium]|nr:RluA family pseudouridine synthase [Acidobacteriota bacterium]